MAIQNLGVKMTNESDWFFGECPEKRYISDWLDPGEHSEADTAAYFRGVVFSLERVRQDTGKAWRVSGISISGMERHGPGHGKLEGRTLIIFELRPGEPQMTVEEIVALWKRIPKFNLQTKETIDA